MSRSQREVDTALLAQAKRGDQRAFEVLFDRYVALVRRGIARDLPGAVRRKISISDVIQEARIVALRRLAAFEDRGPGSFGAWLNRIVEVKVHEAVRKFKGPAKRDVAREVEDRTASRARNLPGREPTPSEVLMRKEDQAAARRALAALPDDYRQILLLTRGQGLTIREAAVRMGRSLEAAKKLSARALAKFGEILGKNGA